MGAAFLNCADATADGWQRRRIRSQPERRRGTSVAAGYGPGPARGGRRRSWYGSKKGITPHALKVQAAVALHPIEPNRQKISPYHPMDPPLPSSSDGVRSKATSDCASGRPPDVDRLGSGLPSIRVRALPALLRAYRTIRTRRTRIVRVVARLYAPDYGRAVPGITVACVRHAARLSRPYPCVEADRVRGISDGCRVADHPMSASLSQGSSRVRSSAWNRRSNPFLASPSGGATIAFLGSGREWPSGGAWCVLTTRARIRQPGAALLGTQAVTKLTHEAQREGREIAGHNPHLEPSHTAPLKAGSITPTRRRPRIR